MTFETILTPQRVDEHTRAGFWLDRTITDYLDEAVGRTPD
jgi:cyclohexanecarboxylate-CoA ligase